MSRENKSKDRIINSFIYLIQEYGYHDVSISDITRHAKISRITFYRNFTGKEDVTNAFIVRATAEVEAAVAANKTDYSLNRYFLILFTAVSPYSGVIRALYAANMGGLILAAFNRTMFRTPLSNTGMQMDFYETRFFSGAFYNVLIAWILQGCQESHEEMAERCSKLVVMKEFTE